MDEAKRDNRFVKLRFICSILFRRLLKRVYGKKRRSKVWAAECRYLGRPLWRQLPATESSMVARLETHGWLGELDSRRRGTNFKASLPQPVHISRRPRFSQEINVSTMATLCNLYSYGRHPVDEETVLKTAGVNTLRGSSPWSSALIECHSPVAQRRRNLVYTQSIDGFDVRLGLLIGMTLLRFGAVREWCSGEA